MYFSRSFNGGQTWSTPSSFSLQNERTLLPIITTDNIGDPIIAYLQMDANGSNGRYVVTRSSDHGNSFTTPIHASDMPGIADNVPATLLTTNNKLILLYRHSIANYRVMRAKISYDWGLTFPDSMAIDTTTIDSYDSDFGRPDGVVIGDTLYAVFTANTVGRIFMSKSVLSTLQLVSCERFIPDLPNIIRQIQPSITNNGNSVGIGWIQYIGGYYKAYACFTEDITAGIPTVYDTISDASSGSARSVDVLIPEAGKAYVAWHSFTAGYGVYRKGTFGSTSVREIVNDEKTLILYPNPSTDHFSINRKEIHEVTNCIITDVSGKKSVLDPVYSTADISFSLKGLAAGIYTVQIIEKNGRTYASKLTIK